MKPLDQIIRDRVWPTLKAADFKRSGRRFTYENAQGNRMVVQVHAYPMGFTDTSFFVDLFLQPLIWRDWMTDLFGGTQVCGGLVSRRLRGGEYGRWALNLDDDEGGRRLTEKVDAELEEFIGLTETERLLAYKLGPSDRVTAGLPEMPLAMLGPSADLAGALAAAQTTPRPDGFDRDRYLTFLNEWVQQRFAETG